MIANRSASSSGGLIQPAPHAVAVCIPDRLGVGHRESIAGLRGDGSFWFSLDTGDQLFGGQELKPFISVKVDQSGRTIFGIANNNETSLIPDGCHLGVWSKDGLKRRFVLKRKKPPQSNQASDGKRYFVRFFDVRRNINDSW